MVIKNKKAMELSMNVIVISIILLLFLIIYFFMFQSRLSGFNQNSQKQCDCNGLLEPGQECGAGEIRLYLPVKNPKDCGEDTPKTGFCCITSSGENSVEGEGE